MSVLVDWQIRQYCKQFNMITPFKEELLNPASLDVVIGQNAIVEHESGWNKLDLSKFSKEQPYKVAPKEFLLVETEEVFNMPKMIAAEFKLKSSRAREGWNQMLAVWLDPGWTGSKLTLEMVNECRFHHLDLYPGLKIGQILFYPISQPEFDYSVTGRYNNDLIVTASKG